MVVIDVRTNNICRFIIFVTIVRNTYFGTKAKQKGEIIWRHWHNTNLHNQIFSQVEKALYPIQTYYIKFFLKCCYTSSHFLYLNLWHQKMLCLHTHLAQTLVWYRVWPNFGCQLWFASTFFSRRTNFLWISNMGCAQSIWVLIGRIMLVLLYLIYDLSLEKIIGTKYCLFHDMFYK
jgi:hypothetical protein